MFIKIGEALEIQPTDLQSADNLLADAEMMARFEKVAAEIKTIAPKAKDFLYFTAVMMHAAEAALLNDDGTLKKDASGKEVTAHWDTSNGTWKWVCSDSNVKPVKNANGDIFPELELIKAHKQWVGKPLCIDHKSDSVDHIRGVIVDTYYDLPKKRVVALCALDKKNYPDLARKVEAKYSTCVSMGTGVSEAICFDCGKVARAERDFCKHMLSKSCYGEINIGLKPIELSIVVNGADPKAKIKHVWAAANSLSQYLEMKEGQLSKQSSHEMVEPEVISGIKKELQSILDKLDELENQAERVEDIEEMEESGEMPGEYESKEASLEFNKKVAYVLDNLDNKVDQLREKVEALSKTEETHMTDKKAYFQGGGGVNEPTPGQVKYPKEDYESVRDNQDKQMVGQSPFPGTGNVEGMHPGYDSFGESEEARKKRLQRLADDQTARAERRKLAVSKAKEALSSKKEAYFQGGGDANEPTPGKAKYPVEDYVKYRDKEDKQMVGQAPFPGVGDVEGLHPSPASADVKDELKRKEMLSRAGLKGKFFKAANPDGTENRGDSCWRVFANDQLILSASVNEISGGKVDVFYDSIASKQFGQKILNTIKSEGFEKAKTLLKSAQAAPPPAELPAPPMDPAGAPAELPELPEEEMVDAGGTGEPDVDAILTEMENLFADLREAIAAMKAEPANELAGFDELAEDPKVAELKQLNKLQLKVAEAVELGMKKAEAEVAEQIKELEIVKKVLASHIDDDKKAYAQELISESLADARRISGEVIELKQAFVNYVRGSQELEKRAQECRKTMKKQAVPLDPDYLKMMKNDPLRGLNNEYIPLKEEEEDFSKYKAPAKPATPAPAGAATKKPVDRMPNLPGVMPEGLTPEQEQGWLHGARGPNAREELDKMLYHGTGQKVPAEGGGSKMPGQAPSMHKVPGDLSDLDMTLPDGTKIQASAQPDLTTKEGRAAFRAKLAQKGLKFSDMLDKAHPGGGATTKLDVKPTGDLAKVERLDETHQKMMDVATAPPKVRKMAEEIQSLVAKGKLEPTDEMFSALVAEGLDKDAVSYWKQYYGQADGGSEFASELVREVAKKKASEKEEVIRTKLSRAYDLADEMVRRGMLTNDRDVKKAQVEDLLKFDDVAFESFKNYVERQPVKKEASMPQVGLVSTAEVYVPVPAKQEDISKELESLFAASSYKPRIF